MNIIAWLFFTCFLGVIIFGILRFFIITGKDDCGLCIFVTIIIVLGIILYYLGY